MVAVTGGAAGSQVVVGGGGVGGAPKSNNEGAVASAPEGPVVAAAGADGCRAGSSVDRLDEVPSARIGNATWVADSAGCSGGSCDTASVVGMVAGCTDLKRLLWGRRCTFTCTRSPDMDWPRRRQRATRCCFLGPVERSSCAADITRPKRMEKEFAVQCRY